MVTRCLCDFCVHLVKWGKYLFADFVGISVGGQASLPCSPCVDLSLSFSLVCSQHFLGSCKVRIGVRCVDRAHPAVKLLNSTVQDCGSQSTDAES